MAPAMVHEDPAALDPDVEIANRIILAAIVVNLRQRSGDFAFWLYVFGVMTFWGGITASSDGTAIDKAFKDSLLFPFALSLIGIGIIALGLYYHRQQDTIRAWVEPRLPESLQRLRPANASR